MVHYLERTDMDKILSLSKRRGFIFQSSEIYGGLNATWDYGPLGVELKRNVKDAWWRTVVHERDDMVGLDAAILMHPQTWVTSGHVESFSDPLVECKECHLRFRSDDLEDPGQMSGLQRRIDGPSQLQPDVQDFHGRRRGHRQPGLSEAGDGPGNLRQLRQRAGGFPTQNCPLASPKSERPSATKSLPATQLSAPGSSSRWRSSTS